jgi:hypothetical protein
MTDAPTTVDELMELDPLDLTAENIDAIIAYHRKARASASLGGKAKRDTAGPKVDISAVLQALGGTPAPAASAIRRR